MQKKIQKHTHTFPRIFRISFVPIKSTDISIIILIITGLMKESDDVEFLFLTITKTLFILKYKKKWMKMTRTEYIFPQNLLN